MIAGCTGERVILPDSNELFSSVVSLLLELSLSPFSLFKSQRSWVISRSAPMIVQRGSLWSFWFRWKCSLQCLRSKEKERKTKGGKPLKATSTAEGSRKLISQMRFYILTVYIASSVFGFCSRTRNVSLPHGRCLQLAMTAMCCKPELQKLCMLTL